MDIQASCDPRRIGGLETVPTVLAGPASDTRRIGGLENRDEGYKDQDGDTRRIGGLEIHLTHQL